MHDLVPGGCLERNEPQLPILLLAGPLWCTRCWMAHGTQSTFWAKLFMIGLQGDCFDKMSYICPSCNILALLDVMELRSSLRAQFWLNHTWLGGWEGVWSKVSHICPSWCFLALLSHAWLGGLEVVWSKMSHICPSCCFSSLLDVLECPQSTFWAESRIIGLLGGCLGQNEPYLPVLLLLGSVWGSLWQSEHIFGWIMHDWVAMRLFLAK